ncbi:MAG: tyrosine decarboxylase MfnA [Halobacteriaceae archaeon]
MADGSQWSPFDALPDPQSFDRVLSSMCTEPHPAAREAAARFLATNPGDAETYPSVAAVEDAVVDGLGAVTGLSDPAGYVASGGTEANLQAVRAACALAGDGDGDAGTPAGSSGSGGTPNVVAPESAHFSFRKATDLLGVAYRTVPTDDDRRADPAAMAAAADRHTALVVGVAGTTEYGRVDPIPALADVAADVGARLHVDAAWGGFFLPFTDREWHFGHAAVDTMTVDPHKTGCAPIPAGGFLARDGATLEALAVETPYLEAGTQYTLTGTRSGAGVAGAWAVLDALWPEGYRERFERVRADADWLAGELATRGYDVVEPRLPLVAVDLPGRTFETLREWGWRISRTGAGETRIVHMPHVERSALEAFLADLDAVSGGH